MRKIIPFDLLLPEHYATDDLNLTFLPVKTTTDNPYSSNGDVLVAVEFSAETDILAHLTDESFILLRNVANAPEEIVSMKLSVVHDIYTFTPLSAISIQPIVKLRRNLADLDIFGKVIFSFHDFAGLMNVDGKAREVVDFPMVNLP
ncbi:hypothetical protein SAMN02745116_00144 [Pilibacter termitis]|uniref:Uncharacterized protein n=1 Tax=Pilibacter termitis TaxID=263852 RepID=A0A1T4K886_9ENTE|nr:hypothetical protein [Pilibacter termitis]SJZ38533.1 hypothetical protein SAMN02745116_00144 [Pilibacter termitis]